MIIFYLNVHKFLILRSTSIIFINFPIAFYILVLYNSAVSIISALRTVICSFYGDNGLGVIWQHGILPINFNICVSNRIRYV